MPAVHWSGQGYQGFGWPQPDILIASLGDYRYGLFTSSPILLLAFAAPWVSRRHARYVSGRELGFLLGAFFSAWLFYGGVHYSRLQFNTGVRYLTAVLPFLFVPLALVLVRLPRSVTYLLTVASLAQAWCMAMYRDVERGFGVLEPVFHVFLGGFQLPWLTVISRIEGLIEEYAPSGPSPLPLFALTAAVLYGLWRNSRAT
jgi:hypothetical protein